MKAFKGPNKQRGFLGIASLAISAISTIASKRSADKAEDKARAANKTQKELNRFRNQQRKRAFLKNFRIAQADAYTTTLASGADAESSRAQGARSSSATQADVAIREAEQIEKLGGEVSDLRQGAATQSTRSAQFGQLASFASQFISFTPKGSPSVEEPKT